MSSLVGPLGAVDRASLFDSLERAATTAGLALFVVHVDAKPTPSVIYCSELLGELLGRPAHELVGRAPWELVMPFERERVRDVIASRGPGASPFAGTFAVERPDGTRIEIEVGVARISTAGAELGVCYFRDMTAANAAAEALRRTEALFQSLIESAPDGVMILQDHRIMLANPVAVRLFGAAEFSQIQGRPLSEFLEPSDVARAHGRIQQILAGHQHASAEFRVNNHLVEVHSVRCEYANKPAILSFVRDVTERRRMQDQLFRGDRLAALGTMAATVAHEINNPLTYLQLNLQRLEREARNEPDPARANLLRDYIANSMHGVERVARIIRDLRAYSRDNSNAPEVPVDVLAVVDRALQMVEHDLRHRAQLVRNIPEATVSIDGNSGHLEQVLINLLVNAIHSLDERSATVNTITLDVKIGADVTITVADTGTGLTDPERVFEPFFTTKGEGTGLGLFVCKQLVERMHGRIEVVSTSKLGTTFGITLPLGRASRPKVVAASAVVSAARLRILVIDDEPLVRDAVKNLLALEHEVEAVADGESALSMLGKKDYDVILCDVMMPRMNGRDVYEQLRTQNPGYERRIVFVTGGAFVPSLAGFLESVENLKLRKPFTVDNVLAVVREANQAALR